MREGDLGASMFAIVSGKVAVSVRERDGETRVAVLGPGDIVGEMSLFTGARRSATVTALKQVAVLEVGKEALDAVLAEEPDLIRRFAEVMEQRESELKSIHAEAAALERRRPQPERARRADDRLLRRLKTRDGRQKLADCKPRRRPRAKRETAR